MSRAQNSLFTFILKKRYLIENSERDVRKFPMQHVRINVTPFTRQKYLKSGFPKPISTYLLIENQ